MWLQAQVVERALRRSNAQGQERISCCPLTRASATGVALFESCQWEMPTFREIKGSGRASGSPTDRKHFCGQCLTGRVLVFST